MDDLFAAIMVGLVMFILGIIAGINIAEIDTYNNCDKYGKNISDNWVMTCEKTK